MTGLRATRARSSRAESPLPCDVAANNSARFCLGFKANADRGVVTGPGEIKILQGGIPSPQTQLRAGPLKTPSENARS